MTDNLYNEILKSDLNKMTLNDSQLFALKETYAREIIDGMDMDTLCQFAYDSLMDAFKDYTEDELKGEILELYDEEMLNNILEEVNTYA